METFFIINKRILYSHFPCSFRKKWQTVYTWKTHDLHHWSIIWASFCGYTEVPKMFLGVQHAGAGAGAQFWKFRDQLAQRFFSWKSWPVTLLKWKFKVIFFKSCLLWLIEIDKNVVIFTLINLSNHFYSVDCPRLDVYALNGPWVNPRSGFQNLFFHSWRHCCKYNKALKGCDINPQHKIATYRNCVLL